MIWVIEKYIPSIDYITSTGLKLEVGGRVNGFYENDGYGSRMMTCEKRIEKNFFLNRTRFLYLHKLTKPTEINNVIYVV